MAEPKSLFAQEVDRLAEANPDIPRGLIARDLARQIAAGRKAAGQPVIQPDDGADLTLAIRDVVDDPDELRAPTGLNRLAGRVSGGVQRGLEAIGLSRNRAQSVAGDVGAMVRDPAQLAALGTSALAGRFVPGSGPMASILRAALPGAVAGATAAATGGDVPTETALGFGGGLLGEAVRGGAAVVRGVRAAGAGAAARREAQLAGRAGLVRPAGQTAEGLTESLLGGVGRAQARAALDLTETGVRKAFGGGQKMISSAQIPELAALDGLPGVRKVRMQTRQGAPVTVFTTTVDDLLDAMKQLNAGARMTTTGGKELAPGFDTRELARTIEAKFANLIPDPAARQAWFTAQRQFAQTEALVKFFTATNPVKGTPQGPRLDFTALQEGLTKRVPGSSTRRPVTFAEELRRVGLGDFVEGVTQGAPLGAADMPLEAIRLFASPPAMRGGSSALRTGFPVTPPFLVPAGQRPLPTAPFAIGGQLTVQGARPPRASEDR